MTTHDKRVRSPRGRYRFPISFSCCPRACLLEEDPLLLEEDEEEEEDEVPSRSQPRAAMSSATAARSGRWRRIVSSHRALIFGRLHSGRVPEGSCEGFRGSVWDCGFSVRQSTA